MATGETRTSSSAATTPENPDISIFKVNPDISIFKVTVSKADLDTWGTHTVFGVFAGMLYGGCKEAMVFSETEQTLLARHSTEKEPLMRRNLLRHIMEEKVLRVSRGTAVGGAKLGLFTAVFSAIQTYLVKRRDVDDAFNVIVAGSATAATVGLCMPGTIGTRIGKAILGSMVTGTIALPLGFAWSYINKEASKLEQMVPSQGGKSDAKYDAVGDAIQRLEKRISSKE